MFDNEVWVKTSVVIVADSATDPNEGSTADVATVSLGGTIVQTSETVVGAGAPASSGKNITDAWGRYTVTGTYGGIQHTGSVYMKSVAPTGTINIRLTRAVGTGLIVFSILDSQGLGPLGVAVWGAQLEVGASATDYVPRTT